MSWRNHNVYGMNRENNNRVSFFFVRLFQYLILSSKISLYSLSGIHTLPNKNNSREDSKTDNKENNKWKLIMEEAEEEIRAAVKMKTTVLRTKSTKQSSHRSPTSNGKMFQVYKMLKILLNKQSFYPSSSLKYLQEVESHGKEFFYMDPQVQEKRFWLKLVQHRLKEHFFRFHPQI